MFVSSHNKKREKKEKEKRRKRREKREKEKRRKDLEIQNLPHSAIFVLHFISSSLFTPTMRAANTV